MKKFLVLFMSVILALGAISLIGCGKTGDMNGTDSSETRVQAVTLSSFYADGAVASVEGAYLSKTITATVLPATAINKKVDFTVSWDQGATHASEAVSDYVVAEQATDGDLTATIKCYKNFGDDTIVITCSTRDGGFHAICTATYAGIASNMAITAPSGVTTASTAARGNYYELYTNTTYNFPVNLTNAIGNAKTKDLTIESQGWSGGDEKYHAGVVNNKTSTFHANWDYESSGVVLKRSILPEKFFSVNLSDTGVSITVNSTIVESYSEYNASAAIFGSNLYLATFINSAGFSYADDTTYNRIVENEALLATRYFYVTVKDNVSNISETIKFWIKSSVESVSLSADTVTF